MAGSGFIPFSGSDMLGKASGFSPWETLQSHLTGGGSVASGQLWGWDMGTVGVMAGVRVGSGSGVMSKRSSSVLTPLIWPEGSSDAAQMWLKNIVKSSRFYYHRNINDTLHKYLLGFSIKSNGNVMSSRLAYVI